MTADIVENAIKASMEQHRVACPNGCGYCSVTAAQVAHAAGIAPRTKQFVIRDEYGFIDYEGCQTEHVLVAISRANNIDLSVNIAARGVHKSFTTGRMDALLKRRFREGMTPCQVCAAVAKIVNEYGAYELHTRSVGEVTDRWLNQHADLFR